MSYMHSKEDSNTQRYYVRNREKTDREYFICRSNGEYLVYQFLDSNPSVVKGSSEPFAIPYHDPVTGKDRRYYVDAIAKIKNKSGGTDTWLVEIKPSKDLQPSKKTKGKKKKTTLNEEKTYLTNKAKLKAAQRYCKLRGGKLKILTEKEIFGQK